MCMKKYITILAVASIAFTSCNKEWTETESKASEFEEVALSDLREKRDNAKWQAEAERTEENRRVLDAYWAQLREYKQKAWLNTGEEGGQVPMVYYWFDGSSWKAANGIARGWLQSVPDSVTAVSIWGGLGGLHPKDLDANRKKDAEIFQKKGGAILMCWQTPSVGTSLPGKKGDEKSNGHKYFREKYPFSENYAQWPQIYARELSRYIIALGFDGYDVDWETCGDHGSVSEEGTPLMISKNNYENIANFVKEMAKYFGPVGEHHHVKTQAEREANLKALFDASTEGFHPNEKEFIDDFKPYVPSDYLTRRYYFCADVPCDIAPIFGHNSQTPLLIADNPFAIYFDKHFMQDYTRNGVNTSGAFPPMLGGPNYNSTSANFQAGGFSVMIGKGKDVKARKVWGLGAYHGQSDFPVTSESDANFKKYLQENNLKRKYLHYAWTREAIRIADPRPDYSGYVEKEPYIITP